MVLGWKQDDKMTGGRSRSGRSVQKHDVLRTCNCETHEAARYRLDNHSSYTDRPISIQVSYVSLSQQKLTWNSFLRHEPWQAIRVSKTSMLTLHINALHTPYTCFGVRYSHQDPTHSPLPSGKCQPHILPQFPARSSHRQESPLRLVIMTTRLSQSRLPPSTQEREHAARRIRTDGRARTPAPRSSTAAAASQVSSKGLELPR